MKMSFDRYDNDWYLLPADMRHGFTEDGWIVTCTEDEFMEDGDETSATAWSKARQKFNKKYGEYKIKHHISGCTFENPQWDGHLDCSGDTSAAKAEAI